MSASGTQPTIRSAVAYSLVQKYVAFGVNLAMSVILARMLTPAETGIFSLAAAVVAMGHLLREFGLADYLIAQKDVSEEKLRAAFTMTVLLAWGVAAILWAAAWPLAAAYSEPGVARTLHLLCLNFLLLPFGTTAFAMLSRQMRFGRIFALQTSATLFGAAVTLWSAWTGMSYLSLALGSVASNLWTLVLLLLLQPRSVFHRPIRRGLREVIGFGGTVTLARVFEQLANRSGDFIVSAMLGFHAGGLLSKSTSLIGSFHEFFNSAIVRVATPAFARTAHADGNYREPYLQGTVVVATAMWLFFPMLGLFAHEIVLVLFGRTWLECVPLVQIAAGAAMLWAPFMLASSLLTARQAVRQQLRMQILSAPLVVLALWIGAMFNLVMVTTLFNAAMFVRLYFMDRAMREVCGIGVEHVLPRLRSSAAVALAGIGAAAATRWLMHSVDSPAMLTLVAGALALLAGAALAGWRMQHPVIAALARAWRRRAPSKVVPRA